MPKYSDYREWENYREDLLKKRAEDSRNGIPSYGDIPRTPSEASEEFISGMKTWLNN